MTSLSNFPTAMDSFVNPNSSAGDTMATVPHDQQHAKINDAVAAIQAKMGINNSTDPTSMDKQLTLKQPLITAGATISAAATDAPTNAPTNYGALAAILGADVNATNAKQNSTASKLNDLSTKFNALVVWLQSQGLMV